MKIKKYTFLIEVQQLIKDYPLTKREIITTIKEELEKSCIKLNCIHSIDKEENK